MNQEHEIPPPTAAAANVAEDVVAKYKRLLSMARSSLEANQASLSSKDQQIAQLKAALEEERSSKMMKRMASGKEIDNENHFPRKILCRVDVDGLIWLLIQYEDDSEDSWKSFGDEILLNEYIQRLPGVPLVCPPKCLSVEESIHIEQESKRRLERVVEEFRRYKVRTEIAKKQKDAELKQQSANGLTTFTSGSNNSTLSGPLEKAFNQGAEQVDQVQRMKGLMHEQELKWRNAYEKVMIENEQLRSKGGESILAMQWKDRYEACLKEKDEISSKLQSFHELSDQVNGSGRSIEQIHMDLQEEFKNFRRMVSEVLEKSLKGIPTPSRLSGQQFNIDDPEDEDEEGGIEWNHTKYYSHDPLVRLRKILEHYDRSPSTVSITALGVDPVSSNPVATSNPTTESNGINPSSLTTNASNQGATITMSESKVMYLRHMILQYLSCKESEVRLHIETALIALLRFNELERKAIENRKKEETTDTLSTIGSFLGSFASTST